METKHLITPEQLRQAVENGKYCLTVGELKKRLENVPDDTPVLFQRIEDFYFHPSGGWNAVELDWDYHEKSEYIPAWCAYTHTEGFLCIDAHY